jgi:predicted Zn-dependent protease
MTMSTLEQRFHEVADFAVGLGRADEVLLVNFYAEQSDFLRFNRSQMRQPGRVDDCDLTLDIVKGARRIRRAIRLTGHTGEDHSRIKAAVLAAREGLEACPEDPHILINTAVHSTRRVKDATLPSRAKAVEEIVTAGQGRDMVGIYAAGTIAYGFANSLGQRNWDQTANFNLDWCFYHAGDKAVKSSYAGFNWNTKDLSAKVETAAQALAALDRPVKTVPAGEYRAFLTPAALGELWGWMSWDSFGLAAHKTKSTALLKLIEGRAELATTVSLSENTGEGVAPGFQDDGFVKPASVPLISKGHAAGALVSPRSAAEYGAQTNGANGHEGPQSLDMGGGDLPEAKALSRLGTGVYVSNLWYVNYSDRNEGRMTGMTRFASMWVEGGEIAAPLNVMRFDDSLYRLLGTNLEALTESREMLMDAGSYERRSVDSMRLPGALVGAFKFTL